MISHYIPSFTRRQDGSGKSEAVCGLYVDSLAHSIRPGCPRCEAWLSESDADLGTKDRRQTVTTLAAQNAERALTGAAQLSIGWIGKHQTQIIRDMRKTAKDLGITASIQLAHDTTMEDSTCIKLADAIEALTGNRPVKRE